MQHSYIDLRRSRCLAEDDGGAFLKPVISFRNLVGMHIKVLCEFGQGLVALERSQGHLRFKGRCVVPTRTSAHLLSLFRHLRRLGNRAFTYPDVQICGTGSPELARPLFCEESAISCAKEAVTASASIMPRGGF